MALLKSLYQLDAGSSAGRFCGMAVCPPPMFCAPEDCALAPNWESLVGGTGQRRPTRWKPAWGGDRKAPGMKDDVTANASEDGVSRALVVISWHVRR